MVAAVDVPVTLKIRTGWAAGQRNALAIARIAEASGIAALAIHGRTRDQQYTGVAEYDTIAEVKAALSIPVIANGDIDGPDKAAAVLRATGCDAVMIGRAAQGRPWIFREIQHYLETGEHLAPPEVEEIRLVMMEHLEDHYRFYGREAGARIARKHISWYTKGLSGSAAFRRQMNMLLGAEEQLAAINEFFDRLGERDARLSYAGGADDTEQDEEQALAA